MDNHRTPLGNIKILGPDSSQSLLTTMKLFVLGPYRAFREVIRSIGGGFWSIIKCLYRLVVLFAYMVIVIPPQVIIYSLGIVVLWPIAKFEEGTYFILSKLVNSLVKAVDSLQSLIESIKSKIETMNRRLLNISFSNPREEKDTSKSDPSQEKAG
jgi:hypothetical protein